MRVTILGDYSDGPAAWEGRTRHTAHGTRRRRPWLLGAQQQASLVSSRVIENAGIRDMRQDIALETFQAS